MHFPPQAPSTASFAPRPKPNAKNLPFPQVTNPAAPPLRPERHVTTSLTTARHHIAADLAWTPQKMGVWVKSLEPVCSSLQFQERYPNISADPTPLLQQVLARDPDADELEAYAAIATQAPDTATADRLTCYAALSSLEFVAQ